MKQGRILTTTFGLLLTGSSRSAETAIKPRIWLACAITLLATTGRAGASEPSVISQGTSEGEDARLPEGVKLIINLEEFPRIRSIRFQGHKKVKEKDLRDIPIIVISGIDGDHAVKDAIAFIKKPFDPEKLVGIVKNTIG